FREREVALHGGELPQAPDGVAEVEVDLRPVERALALGLAPLQAALVEGHLQRVRGTLGHLRLEDGLAGQRGQVDHGIAESERAMCGVTTSSYPRARCRLRT